MIDRRILKSTTAVPTAMTGLPSATQAAAAGPDHLKTTEQTAVVLGFHPGFLAKARLTGTGPRFLKIGRAVRYRRTDVDAWLSDKARNSTSEIRAPEV
jgi:helix-turn-helix protein